MDCLYLFRKNEFFPNRNVRSEETLSLFLIFSFKIESASKYFFCKIKFSIILFHCLIILDLSLRKILKL